MDGDNLRPPSSSDLEFLCRAVAYLERPSFAIQVINIVGAPAEKVLNVLPESVKKVVENAVRTALTKSMEWAVRTLRNPSEGPKFIDSDESESGRTLVAHGHTAAATLLGGASGFFGLAALPIELPLTTIVMLRSVASIAGDFGFDVRDPAVRLECVSTLALGAPSKATESSESVYLSSRAGLGLVVKEGDH
jgi:hypothetical protein